MYLLNKDLRFKWKSRENRAYSQQPRKLLTSVTRVVLSCSSNVHPFWQGMSVTFTTTLQLAWVCTGWSSLQLLAERLVCSSVSIPVIFTAQFLWKWDWETCILSRQNHLKNWSDGKQTYSDQFFDKLLYPQSIQNMKSNFQNVLNIRNSFFQRWQIVGKLLGITFLRIRWKFLSDLVCFTQFEQYTTYG